MNIPNHVAFIMDGNGRWAKQRGLARLHGHKRGLDVAERVIDHSLAVGIKYLSLYVFSTENWKRPQSEINNLFALADRYLSRFDDFCKDRVRVVVSGEKDGLPQNLANKISYTEERTKDFNAICVNLCINYGGQTEIVDAVNKLVKQGKDITVDNIRNNLYQRLPDPDLIIRTGGQKRLSNFLLFQSAYSELVFSDTLWPDFTNEEYDAIIEEYGKRTRNFGGINGIK